MTDVDGEETHEKKSGDQNYDYYSHGGAYTVVIAIVWVVVGGLSSGEGDAGEKKESEEKTEEGSSVILIEAMSVIHCL